MSLPRPMRELRVRRRCRPAEPRISDSRIVCRLRVGQLQRHVVLAGNRLDHADADQRQRTRQVLRQVDHLRALHADGRLDLVARDHRARARPRPRAPRRRSPCSFFSISAAGHLQRLGRHASPCAPGAASSRSTCGSLVSASSLNSGFCRSLATRSDFGTSTTGGSITMRHVVLDHLLLVLHHVLALELRLPAQRGCPRPARCAPARRSRKASSQPPMRSASAQPGEAQRQRHAQHQRGDPHTPEPAKPSQLLRQRAEHVAQHAAGVPPGSSASNRYRRVHSSAQLAAISSTRPTQNTAARRRGCASGSSRAARRRQTRPSQARSTTGSHQTE